ncbi:MAG: hypothetical protein K0S78_1338 [Thermomicrobiales bacterium]|jgi:SAM-dependent methyltransferase|nr:hypothetical protein [Thermomicrobiales bacterium]
MTSSHPYDGEFYARHAQEALRSARSVVPWIIEFVGLPASVVDVGCGTGEWLAAFQQFGVSDILGIDGPWVPVELMHIPPTCFAAHDLGTPLSPGRTFELAISLETAEHLPPDHAALFVESLVRLAPLVVFSSAVPFQPGVDHKNLQWPAYWATMFGRHGFVAIDCIRPRIWETPGIPYWYKQNMILYADSHHLDSHEWLQCLHARHGGYPLPIIHPDIYMHLASRAT